MRVAPFLLASLLAAPLAKAEDSAFVEFKVLKPELALKMAVAAMDHCRAEGFQVGVAVTDRFGNLQVYLRDQLAGLHVEEAAQRKAWTAVSFRSPTLDLDKTTQPGALSAAIRDLTKPLMLGGGVPVEAGGVLVAGIGVSGAPGPDRDDACARAGIAAIEMDIGF